MFQLKYKFVSGFWDADCLLGLVNFGSGFEPVRVNGLLDSCLDHLVDVLSHRIDPILSLALLSFSFLLLSQQVIIQFLLVIITIISQFQLLLPLFAPFSFDLLLLLLLVEDHYVVRFEIRRFVWIVALIIWGVGDYGRGSDDPMASSR